MNELSVLPAVTAEGAAERYARGLATGSLVTGLVRVGVIPAGVLAAVVLARGLGPRDLGIFAVASSLVWWAQAMLNALFNRTTVKFVAETSEWQPVATALIQLQFVGGVGAGVVMFLAAPLLSAWFNAPALEDALHVLAFALPILSLSRAHQNTVIGRRAFERSAFFALFFNGSRALFILLLVGLGGGMMGALLAQLGAALVELAYARFLYRPALLSRVALPWRRIARYSAPMFVEGLGRQVNPRVDLWSVQAFVGSTASGYYSAAQSALSPLTSLSLTLSPFLLATLTHAQQQGQTEVARNIARHALRLLFCALPFIALFAGASTELVTLVFGRAFLDAAPLLTWLSLGVFANLVLSLTTVMLAALDRPGAIAVFTLPMLVASVAGSLLLVPRLGAIGAATTTVLTQWGAMLASLWLVQRRADVAPGATTIQRVLALAGLAYQAAGVWHAPGFWVIPLLGGLCTLFFALLFATRLVTREDLLFLRSLVTRRRAPREDSELPLRVR